MVLLHYLTPEEACGAYLGNLHEVVAACGEVEHQTRGNVLDIKAEVGEVGQEVVGGGQGEAEFLHDVGAGVVDVAAIDGEHTEFGQVGLGVFNQFLGLLVALFFATLELAVKEGVAIDVVVAAAFDLFGVETALFDHFDE